MKIKVEERSDYKNDINCPFCKLKIMDIDSGDVEPCEHTLFIAHDEGFEFCDERTKRNLNLPLADDPSDHEDKFENFDEMTSQITIPNSKKIAVYVPAPSFFGAYYGFVDGDNI